MVGSCVCLHASAWSSWLSNAGYQNGEISGEPDAQRRLLTSEGLSIKKLCSGCRTGFQRTPREFHGLISPKEPCCPGTDWICALQGKGRVTRVASRLPNRAGDQSPLPLITTRTLVSGRPRPATRGRETGRARPTTPALPTLFQVGPGDAIMPFSEPPCSGRGIWDLRHGVVAAFAR